MALLAGPIRGLLTLMLDAISTVTAQIEALDRQAKRVYAAHKDEVRRLTQGPGIGALTAFSYTATLDDSRRFRPSHDVGANPEYPRPAMMGFLMPINAHSFRETTSTAAGQVPYLSG